MNSDMKSTMLSVRDVSKNFGQTQALVDARLDLRWGEICGLLGANGAGKSTLSRIISGHILPSGGEITHNGKPFEVRSTRDALRMGIALVAQETSLAPDMSVLENIFLPELRQPGALSFSRLRDRATEILTSLRCEHILPLTEEVRKLSAAQRQLVEIAKALALEASLVIFDEPTAALSPMEVDKLFDVMTRLRESGKALVFVSHRLEEVFAITDRVTILREGTTVIDDVETRTLTQSDIIRHMVGKEIGQIYAKRQGPEPTENATPVLEVSGLRSLPEVRDISFKVQAGEIMGLGGLVGAGRSEAAEAIFGLRHRDAGIIMVDGKTINPRKPADAISHGIGMVAEDRRAQNIIPDMTVGENLYLAQMGQHRGFGRGFDDRPELAENLMTQLGLPRERLGASILTFSGGMQQKIIIARWLLVEPRILILDEPTKGVDIGTRASIYTLLQQIADSGVAIIVISSDFEELLGLCGRVVVISDGTTIADLPVALLDEETLTLLAAPRMSTRRNMSLLNELSEAYSGTATWTLIHGDNLICLVSVQASDAPSTGLQAGQAMQTSQTNIPRAFSQKTKGTVEEKDGSRVTILRQLTDKRGHDLGWISLTIDPKKTKDSLEHISGELAAMFAREDNGEAAQ